MDKMGVQDATVILFVKIITVCSVFQSSTALVSAVSESLLIPSIHSDTKGYVLVGEPIRLVCQINIPAGVNLDITWKAPPNLRVVSKNNGRIKIGPLNMFPVEGDEHREIASQELIVERATMADDGTYQCEVQDFNNQRNYLSSTPHVCVLGEHYVKLREENIGIFKYVRPNVNGITSSIDIAIEYRSCPANITYHWVNDKGSEITEGPHGKYELSHNDTHVKLRINDPTVYDAGHYILIVKAGDVQKKYRNRVNVIAKPIVQMESKFVKLNEEVSFKCRSIAFPRADISFAFVPCSSKPWTNCSISTSAIRTWDTPSGMSETRVAKARTYNITATHPGVVYCKATNIEGSEVTQADLLISDLLNAITLVKERPKETITVGDHVTIVCSALVYNYTDDITFVHNDKALQVSDGVSHNYSPQLYAWQARLDIDNVTKEHEGPIYCQVKTIDNVVGSRALYVKVLDPAAPTIVSRKSNETRSVDLQDPLKLECDVIGTPEPKIVWLKDGEQVQPDENSNRVQLTKSTLIFESLKKGDLGMFECRAENKMGITHKYWKVEIRSNFTFLSNLSNQWRYLNGITSLIDIVIEYRSYAINITYYWVNDAGVNITKGHPGKYELSRNNTHVKLRINDPTVYDAGNYILIVKVGDEEETYRMRVNVVAKPIVQMESMIVKLSEEVFFKCRSIGYPRPDISFAFVPCLSKPWTNCSMPSSLITIWDTPRGTGESQIVNSRTYNITPTEPGVVYCKASNIEGSEVTQADLLISDLPDAITLAKERPKETITVGDHVTIVCSALVYNYTDDISFVHNDKELQASDGVSKVYSPQLYAWQARLDIDNVTKEHEGPIYCWVKTICNAMKSRAFYVKVLDPVAPTLLSGKSNEIITVNWYESLELECDVIGTPDPRIVWLKDGEPLTSNEKKNRLQLSTIDYPKMDDSRVFECRAENKMGITHKYWKVVVRTAIVSKSLVYINLGLLVAHIVGILLVSMFYCKKKKNFITQEELGINNFEEGNLDLYNPDLALDEQADLLPYNIEYEFPKERLKLDTQLGTGAFGVVMKATATRIMEHEEETMVAVKMVKKPTTNEVFRALLSELKIMVHLGQHLNVVNLLGAVTKNIAKRELMVIVEYCRFGNVQNFLLKHRPYFVDQINQKTGEIDSSINENQLGWSNCGYQYNSFNHPLEHPTAFYHNNISSESTQYVHPTKNLTLHKYIGHPWLQNRGIVDSCNQEVITTTSVEVEDLNTINSNEAICCSNCGMDYKGTARTINTTNLVCWASQIACGMEYLASRKVLHGDLAARNILLCDDNVVKICDFGLARSMYKSGNYKKKEETPLPFKWLALECISDHVFSTYSDVWAYGIVLWELFSLGMVPYPGMEANQELYNKLCDGYRMDKPQYSNQDIYDIMVSCWYVKPDSRPSFKDLKRRFNAMLPDDMRDHYLELNEPYLQMKAAKMKRGETDYLASLGPPEEPAPAAANNINGIILPIPPISEILNDKDCLEMPCIKSESEETLTIHNNLDSSPANGSKRLEKRDLPKEIPMHAIPAVDGFSSNSETEASSPKP